MTSLVDPRSTDPGSAEFSGLRPGEILTRSFRVTAKDDASLGEAMLTAHARVAGKPVASAEVPLTIVKPVEITGPASPDLVAGRPTAVAVKVTSNLADTSTTKVQAVVASGWTGNQPDLITLNPGETKTVKIPITPAKDAFGNATVTLAAKGEFPTVSSTLPAVVSKPVTMVGEADLSTHEFALNPDRNNDYPSVFPNDVTFTAGKSDPATNWSYVQPGPADAWAGSKQHTFRLTFNLGHAPSSDLTFTAWLYDTHDALPPALTIGLNGATVRNVQTAPGAGRGHRGADGIKPSTLNVTLPVATLKSGDNTLTVTTTSGSWMVYDAFGIRQLP
ncbi:polysaccharide lyase family protein [Streptomyces sp. NPDC001292]|uniref:polysaccharide lyase family protein n=1 Tax=Streptomyces sp. NPDC001292 TaxID=3364558 RepID=UPI00369674A9